MNQKHILFRATILIVIFFVFSSLIGLKAQNAGPDKTVTCSTSVLEADPDAGTWTSLGPAVVTFPAQFNSPVTGLVPGPNVFQWDVGGVIDQVTITVVPADAGLPQTVCSSTFLNGNNVLPGTGYWTSSSAAVIFDDSTSPTAEITNLPFGNTNFTWHVVIEGCETSDVVVITNDMPTVVNAGPDDVTCNGSFTLAGTNPAAYPGTSGEWTVIGGNGVFVDEFLFNTAVNGLDPGPNTFRWTLTKGTCSDFDDVIITNNGVTATASNQSVCTNSATLDGNLPAGTTGQWSVVASTGIITNTANPNSTVTNLNPNNNTFEWTLTKGTCTNSVVININYSQLTVDAGPDQNICGSTTTLNGNIPGVGETGTWTVQAGSGTLTDNTLYNTTVTGIDGLANNIYRWTISKPGCTPVWDDVIVIDNALPADAGADQLDICTNTVNLQALSGDPSLSGGSGVWSTPAGATITDPSNYQTTATNLQPGISVFRWTVTKNGCSVWDEMTVTRSQYFISAGPDQTICDNFTTLQGSNPGPGGSGTWTIEFGGPANIADPNLYNSGISNIGSFPITLRWTVVGTCTGFDEVTIYDQGTTQAEIADGDAVYAGCNEDFYNGLSAVNPAGGGETLLWSEITSNGVAFSAPNGQTTNVTNLPLPGVTQVELTITDGVCTTRDTISITTGTPVTADAGADIGNATYCQQYIYLNAVDPTPAWGTWSINPADPDDQNVYIEDPNDPNTLIITRAIVGGDPDDGDFDLIWTVTNGSCSDTDNLHIENYATAYAGEDMIQCGDAVFQMDAAPTTNSNPSSGEYGIWDFSFGGITLSGGQAYWSDCEFTISNTTLEGAYPVIWTYSNKLGGSTTCVSEDTLIMYFLEDLSTKPMTAGTNQTICGTTATITDATVPSSLGILVTGEWSGPAGVTFNPLNSPTTTVSNLGLGPNILTWTVDNTCSTNNASVTITVSGLTGVDAGDDQYTCDDFATLQADPMVAGESGYWSIVSGSGAIQDLNSNETLVTNLGSGANVFRWTLLSPFCNSEDTVMIYSNRPSPPDAGPDRYLCGTGTMLAQAPTNPGEIAEWIVTGGSISVDDNFDRNTLVDVTGDNIGDVSSLVWRIFRTAPNGLQCWDQDIVNVYNYEPASVDAGNDRTVCTGINMQGNAPLANETGRWDFIQGFATFTDQTLYNTWADNFDYTQPNLLTWTISGPDRPGPEGVCSIEDTVQVISNRVDVEAGPDIPDLCGDSQLLDANCPTIGTGAWSVTSGSGVFSANTCNATVSNLANGPNVLRWTITYNGCPSYDEVTVINNLPDPLPDAGLDKTVCGTTTMAGNVPIAGTGTWTVISGAGTFANPSLNNTVVTGLNYGSNLMVWTIDNNGCARTDTVDIWSDVVGADAGIDETVCTNSHTLNANDPSPGVGTWTPAGTTATIVEPTNRNTIVTGMNPGPNIFRWTITNAACSTFDDVIITNDRPTTADAGPDQIVCVDNTNMNGNVPIEGTGLWSTASSDAIIADSTDPFTAITNLPDAGVTMFTWTITKGSCVSTDNVQIQYISTSTAGGPDQHICVDTTSMNAATPPTGSGVWSILVGSAFTVIDDPTSATTHVSGLQPGETVFLWSVTNAAACVNTDTVSIFNDGPYPVYAGPDRIVCSANSFMEATPLTVGTGVWTTAAAGVTFANNTVATTAVYGLPAGSITTLTWTATYGSCVVQDNVTFQNDSVGLFNAGINQYVCTDTAAISAEDPTPLIGTWDLVQGLGTIDDPTNFATIVRNLGPGENVFRWTVASQTGTCTNFDFVRVFNMEVQADAGSDQTVCTGDVVLQGNNPAGQFILPTYNAWGRWEQIPWDAPGTITNSAVFNTTATGLDNDLNVFRWTISNGYCSDWDEVNIYNWEPTVADAGPDTIVCSTSLNNLYANEPIKGTGFWRRIAGSATITDISAFDSEVTNLDYNCTPWTPDWWTSVGAVNVFEWVIDYNGCQSTDQVRVLNGLPEAPDAGLDQTVCDNTVNLDALDEGSCTQSTWWEELPNVGDYYDPDNGNPIPDYTEGPLPDPVNMPFNTHVEGIQNGMTQFVWHKKNEFQYSDGTWFKCELTDTVEITSLGGIEDVQAGTDDATCDVDYWLDATPPDAVFPAGPPFYSTSGQWTTIFGTGTFDDDTYYNTWVRGLSPQTNIYRWTITNHTLNCTMTDDVYIESARPSNANAGPDNTVCVDFAILSANVPARFTGAYWSVLFGGATLTNNSCTSFACDALASNLGPGNNVFLWTVYNTYEGPNAGYSPANPLVCSLYDTLTINNQSIVADAGNTIYICADTAQLNANLPVGATGLWQTGSGSFASTGGLTSTLYNDVIRNLSRGKNTFLWTVDNGTCSDNDQLIVWDNLPDPNPNAGFDQVICTDETTLASNSITRNDTWYNLSGTLVWQEGYSTQEWTVGLGAGTFDNSTLTNTWVRNIAVGDNEYVWNAYYHFTDYRYESAPGVYTTFNQTCQLTDIVNIYNNSVIAEAGSAPGIVCGVEGLGATHTLGATQVYAPMSGSWAGAPAPGATILEPTLYNSQVIGMQNGDHIYHWTVSSTYNGTTCFDTDQVTVRVRIPTTAVVAAPSTYEICEDFTTLQANVPVLGTGTWTEIPVSLATITDPTNNVTTASGIFYGPRQFEWTIDNDGCTSSDTLTVNNNMILSDADVRIPQAAILHGVADNDTAICQNWYQLEATDPNNYNHFAAPYPTGQWTAVPGSITFDNPTQYNTIARNLSNTGTNTLFWTITKGGCVEISRLDIINNEFTVDAEVDVIVPNPNYIETCTGSATMVGEQPGPGGTGEWTINIGSGFGVFQNPTLYNTAVTNIQQGLNTFTWTVTRNGCTASDDVTVENNSVSTNAGVDQTTCNDSYQLAAGQPLSGESGVWVSTIPGVATVTTPTLYNSWVTGLVQGDNTFRWTITKGNCDAWDEVIITNNAPDPFIIEPDKEVCSNNSTLSVNPAPAIGTGSWSIVAAGVLTTIVDPTSINTPVTDLQPGINEFAWTVSNGTCSRSDNVVLTNNTVVANAGLNQSICTNTTNLAAIDPTTYVPGLGTGSWTLVGGNGIISNSLDRNTAVTGLGIGLNTFRWTLTEGGCTDFDDVQIINQTVVANATDITTCTMPVNLTGNDPVTADGLWINLGGVGTIANPTLYNSEYTGLPNRTTNSLTWRVYNSLCSDEQTITVTNNNFSISAGTDQTLCGNSTTLNGGSPLGGTGQWTIITGGGNFVDDTFSGTVVNNINQGVNTYRWTVIRNGCTNFADVDVTNNSPDAALIANPFTGVDETCDGTYALEANDPVYGTGQWSLFSGAGTISDPTNYQTNVSGLAQGPNVFVWTIRQGICETSASVTINNNEVFADAGGDQTLCTDFTSLSASNPALGSGIWTNVGLPGPVFTDATYNNTVVSNLNDGLNTFRWTVTEGSCSDFDDVEITNNSVVANATNISTCNSSVQLTGNDPSLFTIPGTGLWTIASGTGSENITTPTLFNSNLTGLSVGATSTYNWAVTNGLCNDNITIQVVNNNFPLSAGADVAQCGDTYTLAGDPVPVGGTGMWTVFSGSATIVNPTIHNSFVTDIAPGNNVFEWAVTNAAGCSNTAQVTITNDNPTTAQITIPAAGVDETCNGTYSLQGNDPVYGTGQWTVSTGTATLSNYTYYQTTATGMSQGPNIFVWTISSGFCNTVASVTINNNQVFANAGTDQLGLCTNFTNLSASDPSYGNGAWTNVGAPGPVIVDPTLNTTLVTDLNSGVNTFRWTVTEGTCSDIDDVVITDNSVTASATNQTTCNTSIQLNGNDPSLFAIPGTGVWTKVVGAGAVSTPTLFNTFVTGLSQGNISSFNWAVTNGLCNDDITIQISNSNFTLSAGADITQCGDTYTLAGDAVPVGGTGSWLVVGGCGTVLTPSSNTSVVTDLCQGDNILEWTVTNAAGCTNSDQVTITNNDPDQATITIPALGTDETCNGIYNLQANVPTNGSGQWSLSSGAGTISNLTNYQTTVSGLAQGPNIFVWTITLGACSTDASVTINNNQVFSNAGGDQVLCNNSTNLAASDPAYGSGTWTNVGAPGPIIINPTLTTTAVTNLNSGINTFRWTVSEGTCSDWDDVTITNNAVIATASDINTCNTTVNLNGNDPSLMTIPGTGIWTKVGGAGTIVTPTLFSSQVTGLAIKSTASFNWAVSAGSCNDDITIQIFNNNFILSAGSDVGICSDTYTLAGDPPPPGGFGLWSNISGSGNIVTPTAYNSLVTGLGQGTNVFEWTVTSAGGCTNSDQVAITNNNPDPASITIPAAGVDQTCDGTYNLQANNPTYGTGLWSLSSGTGTINDPTNYQTLVSGLGIGPNVFVWTITNGACSFDATVTINNNQVTASAGGDQSLCSGSTNLSATDPAYGSGTWTNIGSPGPVIVDPTLATTTVTNLNIGTNSFRWTVVSGICSDFDDVVITNNSVTALASDIVTCNTTVALNGNDPSTFAVPGTGLWTNVGPGGTIQTPTLFSSNIVNIVPGSVSSYNWEVTSGSCSDDITIQITNNSFTLSAGADANICTNTYTLGGDQPPVGGSGNWTILTGGGNIVTPSAYNSVVTNLGNGNNTLRWTVTNTLGCTVFDDVIITNNSPTTAQITIPATGVDETCTGTYSLQANSPVYGTGQWSVSAGAGTFSDPTSYQTTVSALNLGPNIYVWTITQGACTSQANVTISNNRVFADAGSNQDLCVSTANLGASDPLTGSGVWTNLGAPGPIIVEPTLNTSTVTNLNSGLNTFRWTVTEGACSDFDDVEITNNSVTAMASNVTSCDFNVQLSGNNPALFSIPGTGVWTNVIGTGTIVTPTLYNTFVNNLGVASTATFNWEVTNGICSDDVTISVTNTNFSLNAGANAGGCSDTYTFGADPVPVGGTGSWSLIGGAGTILTPSAHNSVVTGLSQGPNIFEWTVTSASGCTNSDQVTITNNNPDVAQIAIPATGTGETCNGVFNLEANDPVFGSGVWSLSSGGGTISDPTNYQTTVSGLAPGPNVFEWTITNTSCVSTIPVTINNNVVASYAGSDQVICTNTTTLNATATSAVYPFQGTGIWTYSGGGSVVIAEPTNANTIVTGIPAGTTGTFTWTVTQGTCSTFDQVLVTNRSVSASGTNAVSCDGNVQLTGNAPAPGETGLWNSFTPGVTYDDNTLFNTIAHNLVFGNNTFVWTLSNIYGCSDDAIIIVDYVDPIANAGSPQAICTDDTYLSADDPSPGTGTWSVLTGSGTFADVNGFNSYVSNVGPGDNTYQWTVNESGCVEVSTVVITNNSPTVNAGADNVTCNNFIQLNGNNPLSNTIPGTGVWTKIGGTGIVATPTLFNTMVTNLSSGVNVFEWTINNGLCTASDQVTINNNAVTSVSAGVDRSICGSSTTLAALAPGFGETGEWTAVSGSGIFVNASLYNTQVNNLSQGDNLLQWTITNSSSCSAFDQVTITNNSPTVPSDQPNQEICTSTILLLGTSPGAGETGIWTNEFGAQGNILDPTNFSTTVTNIGPGSNTFRWTISNSSCSEYDDIIVTNNSISTDAGLDYSVCSDTAQLSADNPAPGTGYWAVVNSAGNPVFDNSLAYSTVVRDLASGSNIFIWTVNYGICSAWDIVNISNDVTTPADAGVDQLVCNNSATLSANNPTVGTGIWSRLGGGGTIANPSNYNTTVTGLPPGYTTFRWTITEGVCVSYDDVSINNDVVYATAGMDDEICGDSYPELNGNQPGPGETGAWTVAGGSGTFANPTLYNTSVTGLSNAENVYTWTITRGSCSNSDNVSIFDNTPTTATVSSNQEICTDETVISGNPPTIGTGEWSVDAGSGVFDSSIANTTTVRNIGPDINQYRWTITNGVCSSSAVITVTNNSVNAYVGDSIFVCGTSAYLNANEPVASNGETGVWTVTAGTGVLANATVFNTQVTNLNVGESKFRWTINNSLCTDYADQVVTNNQYAAFASVAGPTTICVDSADLLGNIPVAGSTGEWSVTAGAGTFDDPLSPTARVYDLAVGENTLTWTITKDGCANSDDVSIINNMVVATAGGDIITCGNNPTLSAGNLQGGESGIWTVLSGGATIVTPTVENTLVTGLSPGVNRFRWTVTGSGIGCTDQDEVQVFENSFTISAGFNKEVCSTTVTLEGEDPSPGTGIWSFTGPGVTIISPTSNTTGVTGLQDNTAHTFRWTVSRNGCQASDEVIITNNLVHAYAGNDLSTCNSSVILNGGDPSPGSGYWTITTGAGFVTDPTYSKSSVTGLGIGTNVLNWTVTNLTCIDIDQVVVTNNEVTASAGIDQQLCQNYTYLAGDPPQPGGYGEWTVAGGTGVIIQTPSAFNSYVSNLQRGVNTLRWTVYENGCDNGGQIVRIYNNTFDAYAGEDQTLGLLDTDTYFEGTLPVGGTGQWSVLSGGGNIANLNSPTSYVSNLQTGESVFSWSVTMPTGCSDSDEVSIIAATFVAEAGDEQIICTNTAVMDAVNEPAATYQYWDIVAGGGVFDNINDPKTIVRNIPVGINTYRWNLSFVGYTSSDVVNVINDSIHVSAGTDATLCDNMYQLRAQELTGGSGQWRVIGFSGGTFADNTLYNTWVSDISPGTNLYEWYTTNGNCESRDTVAITYNLPPNADFVPSQTTFCAPSDITLTNLTNAYAGYTEPDSFVWDLLGTTGYRLAITTDVATDVIHNFTNTGTTDSIYQIQLIAYDYETMCSDTALHSITAYASPVVEFSPSTHQKRFPDATFGFENLSDPTLSSYVWNFGDGTVEPYYSYSGYIEHSYATWGTFEVTLTGSSAGNCNAIYRDTIVILPPCPFSYADPSVIARGCEDLTVEFSSNIQFADSIEWKFYGDYMYPDSMSNLDNPVFTYTEAGEFYPIVRAWSNGCDQVYERRDTVIVYEEPIADFDVSPRLVMIPDQAIHCYNYSQYGSRYLWDFGDGNTSTEEGPLHYYQEAGIYDISLSVWTEHDCFDSIRINDVVFAEEPGMIEFPNAFTPNPNGPSGGQVVPCDGNYHTQIGNDVFYPLHSGVIDYQLEIYNRWGEKLFVSNDICIGWDGYVDGVLAPQDVYVWKVSVIYENGEPYKEYGSVTLLR